MRPERARPLARALLLLCAAAAPAGAQRAVPPQLELRADAIIARESVAAQLGAGVNAALGTYVRVGLTAAAGASRVYSRTGASGRVDLVARFLFDPFREHRWGPYAGAGLSALWNEQGDPNAGGDQWRGAVVAVLGLEGSAARSVRPSLEVGLGGGARVGAVLRWGRRDRR